jgi:hypothetical protein
MEMDKQELIDKAVEDLKGVLPEDGMYLLLCKQRTDEYKAGQYAAGNSARPHESYWDVICTTEKFTTRASELGWINGFKWGVEYPTNGNKPNLPDGIQVQRKSKYVLDPVVWNGHVIIDKETSWDDTTAFRIVDERYKPKESQGKPSVDGVKSKLDNSWHERGELPPVGTICESYDFTHSQWAKVKTLDAITGSLEIACVTIDESEAYGRLFFGCKFRPIKSERDKFVEAALGIAEEVGRANYRTIFSKMHDAGFKAPDEKSCS